MRLMSLPPRWLPRSDITILKKPNINDNINLIK